MANRKYIYFSEMDRFGYTLHCISLTEKECREAMIAEYIRRYKYATDVDPKEAYEWMQANEGKEDIEELDEFYEFKDAAEDFGDFLEELYIDKRELNKVEWD